MTPRANDHGGVERQRLVDQARYERALEDRLKERADTHFDGFENSRNVETTPGTARARISIGRPA